MRKLIAAAGVAILTAGAAQAAVVDLTYTVEAQITAVTASDFSSDGFDLNRQIGDIETFEFGVYLLTEFPELGPDDSVNGPGGSGIYSNFDLNTGAGFFPWAGGDEQFIYELFADGSGSLDATIAAFGSEGLAFETAAYDVLSWTVAGLPDIAPVPLPASGYLLLAGLLGLSYAAMRRAAPGSRFDPVASRPKKS